MLCDPSVDHRFDFFVLDELTALYGGPAFFDKGQKARLLLRSMANGPCRKPGPAPPLSTRYTIHQGKRFRIQAGGDDGATHKTDVYLVYIRFKGGSDYSGKVFTTSIGPTIAALNAGKSSAGIQYSRCARPPAS